MCGRFGSDYSASDLEGEYKLAKAPLFDVAPHYNIAPSQLIIGVTKNSPFIARQMLWGFVPTWGDPGKSKIRPINARAEKINTSFYKGDFERNRCLIPANWFYEWKRISVDGKEKKIPYLIQMRDKRLFSFAGVYSVHEDARGKDLYLAAIITTKANSLMKSIHERMPVIVEKHDYELYMDGDARKVVEILKPLVSSKLEAYRVSKLVNNPMNDNRQVTEAVED